MDDKCKTFSKTVTPLNIKEDSTADADRDEYSEAGFSTTKDGKRAICADCNLKPRPDSNENLCELHAELQPNCLYVRNVIKKKPIETVDFAAAIAPKPEPDANSRNMRQGEGETGQAEDCEPSALGQLSILLDQLSTLESAHLCKICKRRPACMLFFPCKDFYSCEACAKEEEECKECNKPILTKEKIFRS